MSELEDAMEMWFQTSAVPAPVREYRFHPKRMWRFDFAWPDHKIALEVEGGIYTGGRHTRGPAFAKDVEKYNEAAIIGWRVLRATNHMVEDGDAIQYVERAFGLVPRALEGVTE